MMLVHGIVVIVFESGKLPTLDLHRMPRHTMISCCMIASRLSPGITGLTAVPQS